jgi:hypothetical protein
VEQQTGTVPLVPNGLLRLAVLAVLQFLQLLMTFSSIPALLEQ